MIIHGDMDILPLRGRTIPAMVVQARAITSDTVTCAAETAQFLDVSVNDFAWFLPLITRAHLAEFQNAQQI